MNNHRGSTSKVGKKSLKARDVNSKALFIIRQ